MAVRVLAVRPRRAARPRLVPVPSSPSSSSSASSRSSSSSVPAVRVGRDELRGLDVAVCDGCAESFASSCCGEVNDWADMHRCDAELAALLALVDTRRAA